VPLPLSWSGQFEVAARRHNRKLKATAHPRTRHRAL
jgi:hypothetical protein